MTRIKDNFMVLDCFHGTTVDATLLSGTVSFDLRRGGLEANHSVANIIITGTMGAGVTLGPIVGLPDGAVCKIHLVDPGVNTWAINPVTDDYELHTAEPVWEAGKGCFYQVAQMGVKQILAGSIKGGTPVPTGGGTLDLPVPAPGGGTEVAWSNAGSDLSWVRGYTGNITAAATTVIGGPDSGTIAEIVETWGGVSPNADARFFHVPYAHPDAAAFAIGIFLGSSSDITYSQGTARQDAAWTYKQWVRYIKEP